jgi:hypothetical protein
VGVMGRKFQPASFALRPGLSYQDSMIVLSIFIIVAAHTLITVLTGASEFRRSIQNHS